MHSPSCRAVDILVGRLSAMSPVSVDVSVVPDGGIPSCLLDLAVIGVVQLGELMCYTLVEAEDAPKLLFSIGDDEVSN